MNKINRVSDSLYYCISDKFVLQKMSLLASKINFNDVITSIDEYFDREFSDSFDNHSPYYIPNPFASDLGFTPDDRSILHRWGLLTNYDILEDLTPRVFNKKYDVLVLLNRARINGTSVFLIDDIVKPTEILLPQKFTNCARVPKDFEDFLNRYMYDLGVYIDDKRRTRLRVSSKEFVCNCDDYMIPSSVIIEENANDSKIIEPDFADQRHDYFPYFMMFTTSEFSMMILDDMFEELSTKVHIV